MMKKKKVLLIGAAGYGNIGDEAILAGLLNTIDGDITVFSGNPEMTAMVHKVRSEKRNFMRFFNSDDIVIGGGDLFQDGMTWKYSFVLFLARIFAKRTKVLGIGVEVNNPVDKILTSLSLRLADEISVRDERSLDQLVNMGLNRNKIKLVDDYAFYLEPKSDEDIQQFISDNNLSSGNFILLALRPKNKETDQLLLEFFNKFIAHLHQNQPELKIVMIPFSKHLDSAKDDDIVILRKLKAGLDGDSLIISEKQFSPVAALYLVSKAALVISTRLHPLIFSSISHTRAVAIPLFPKIRSFAERHGFPIVESDNPEELLTMVEQFEATPGSSDGQRENE